MAQLGSVAAVAGVIVGVILFRVVGVAAELRLLAVDFVPYEHVP